MIPFIKVDLIHLCEICVPEMWQCDSKNCYVLQKKFACHYYYEILQFPTKSMTRQQNKMYIQCTFFCCTTNYLQQNVSMNNLLVYRFTCIIFIYNHSFFIKDILALYFKSDNNNAINFKFPRSFLRSEL